MPTRLQYQTTECGVAVLAMILAYYGRHVPMEDVRRVTGVSRDCLNAADMVRAGRHYGLDCAAYSREPNDLHGMAFPFVAHLNFIHFVVVEGMTPDSVLVNDPACGRSEIPLEQFDEAFTGIVITLEPGPGFATGGRKDQVFRDLWQRIGAGVKGRFALALIAACLASLAFVSMADNVAGSIESTLNGRGLTVSAIATTAGLLLVRGALNLVQALALESARHRMSTSHTAEFLQSLIGRPFAYLSYRLPSEQVRSVYDTDRVASLLCRDILPAMLTLPVIVVLLAALFMVGATVGGTAAAAIVLNGVCLTVLSFWRAGDGRKAGLGRDDDFRAVHGQLTDIESSKIAGMDRDYVAGNMGKQAASAILEQSDAIARITGHAISGGLVYAVLFCPVLVAGSLYRTGTMDLSGVVTSVFLSCALAHAMRDWPQLRGRFDALFLALLRQDDLKVENLGVDEPPLRGTATGASPLRFENVVFGHSPNRAPLLNGVDFAFQGNAEQVGITGPSAGGKSTFASIAAGLHMPWTGIVETDERVMWIDKSPFLFEGTVRENLLLWRDDVDDAALQRALGDACLDDDIAARAGGLDAPVLARGRNFSGGQRQRLEIARALTFDPSVLILDEALDALNPALEQELRANLRARGCALIVVSHRASTLDACDRVLHFHDGKLERTKASGDTVRALPMRERIETVSDAVIRPRHETKALRSTNSQVADVYSRTVRFQQSKHWQQPHLPLMAWRRNTRECVRLVPASGGYHVENETPPANPDDFEDVFLCTYRDADLSARSPGTLLRGWLRVASPDLTRALVVTAFLSAATITLAFFSSLPFLATDTPLTWKLWMSLSGCLLIAGLADGDRRLSALRAEHRVRVAAYSDLLQRLIRIRPGFFRHTSPSDLGRMLAGWYRLQKLIHAQTSANAADILIVVACSLSLGWLDIRLGLTGVAMSALWIGGCRWLATRAIDAQLGRDDQRLAGRRFLLDMMQGIARLRVVGGAARAATRWHMKFVQELELSARAEHIMSARRTIGDIWLWAAMWATALLVAATGATTADALPIAAGLLLAWVTFAATLRVGEAMAGAQLAGGALPDVRRLLAAPMEQTGISPAATAAITLEGVAFRYDGSDAAVLEDIALRIAPGAFVALVGPSGSGKSTLLRLLLDFEMPSCGRRLIGDQGMDAMDIAAWRRGIGVVQQTDQIESATTIRSIISGLADVSLDDVWHAADLALLGDDIRAMPMGMQTIVEHGKLSTGQEQRLLIAQQLLRQPDLLILDEATNAIPETTQARLFENLRAAGIGCILATHRESAIAAADRVFVMDRGRMVWEGSPTAFAASDAFTEMLRRERLAENNA